MATAADALLEQFVEQGKSVSGRAAAELIEQATSAPGLFAFGELLDLDSVKQVRGGRKNKKPLPCFPLPFSNQNPSIPPKTKGKPVYLLPYKLFLLFSLLQPPESERPSVRPSSLLLPLPSPPLLIHLTSPHLPLFLRSKRHDRRQQLEGGEFAPSVTLLRLFAYGTLADYRRAQASSSSSGGFGLPALNASQELKLKKLTVATLAEGSKVLHYDELMRQLEVPTVRELEDLLIDECTATGLVRGKLDQRRRCFEVHHAIGRDLRPGQLKSLIATIADWHANARDVLSGIEEKIRWANEAREDQRRHKERVEARVAAVKKTVKTDIVDAAVGRQEQLGLFGHHMSEDGDGLDMMDEDMRSGIGSKRRR